MTKNNLRIALVDDEQRALNRIKILIQHFDHIDITGEFTNPYEAVEHIKLVEPDLVLLDVEMPGLSGIEIVEEINRSQLKTKTILCTSYKHYAIKALRREVFDYLVKPIDIDDLRTALDRLWAKSVTNLTKRETEIVKWIAKGKSSKEIAELLYISPHTVGTHRKKILNKTNCKNATELTHYAITNKIV